MQIHKKPLKKRELTGQQHRW